MSDLQSYLDIALKQVDLEPTQESFAIEQYDVEAEICQLIVVTRTSLGLTQKQLSQRSGISQANISKIENGNYRPSIAVLKKIADGLGKRLVIEFVNQEEVL